MAAKLRAVRTAKARARTIAQQIEIGPHMVVADANKCPVYRTLAGSLDIISQLE